MASLRASGGTTAGELKRVKLECMQMFVHVAACRSKEGDELMLCVFFYIVIWLHDYAGKARTRKGASGE